MSYFVLTVKHQFSAARALRDYEGKCQNIHGHNYGVEVKIATPDTAKGYSLDFYDVKIYLGKILQDYDVGYLNERAPFIELNPTTENIAKWIYETLLNYLTDKEVILQSVTVKENDDFSATYYPEDYPHTFPAYV